MNKDLEDKMRITQVKSLEAAEKVKSIFHTIGALNLGAAIFGAIYLFATRDNYQNKINNALNDTVNSSITITNS